MQGRGGGGFALEAGVVCVLGEGGLRPSGAQRFVNQKWPKEVCPSGNSIAFGRAPRRDTTDVEGETAVGKSCTIGRPNLAHRSAPKWHLWGQTLHCRHTAGALRAHCGRTAGAKRAHCRHTVGALRAHCGRTAGALRAHCGRTAGALPAHCGHMYQRPPRGDGGRKHQATHADAATQQNNLILRCLKSL